MLNGRLFLYSVLLCYLFLSSSTLSAAEPDDNHQLQILLSLKSSIQTTSNSDIFTTWSQENPICQFAGVLCNSNNKVTEIDLSNKGLAGTISFDLICKLPYLSKLALGANSLSGEVSKELNKCVELVYLDLGQNGFTSSVPDISSLVRLEHLYLNGSEFSGPFPFSSLSSMTNLTTLSIGDNPFDRTDSFPEEILKLRKLYWIFMSNCSIQGIIPPEIGDLMELRNLELANNHLTGTIPAEIGKLHNLWQLELYKNNLTGTLPLGFRNLTNLQKLDVSKNQLSGDLSELRFLTKLVSIQMFENQLSGEIPSEFGEFKHLVNISLYTNKLTGSLPRNLGSWAEFGFIDVSENFLTGSIPPDMCKKGTMFALLLLQNNISGSIPESYGTCTTLRRFRVSNNMLSGTVPAGIWGLPLLNIIDISSNQLEGLIDSSIGRAKSLTSFRASGNKLSGELPQEITLVTSLESIDLQNNQISGVLPDRIGDLKELSTMYLQNNEIAGSIPKSIGLCSSLNDLNIAENSLSGRIPSSLGSLQNLNSLNLSGNELSGSIPMSLSSLRLSLLDLSSNKLTGRIPQELSIEAYNDSFTGNIGLCSENEKYFQPCTADSTSNKQMKTLMIVFVIALVILLITLSAYLLHKRVHKHQGVRDPYLNKRDSWNLKSFHVLTFTEDDVLNCVNQSNIIGKGGSGNVYRLSLPTGKDLAVKHIWTNGEVDSHRAGRITSPMLGKRNGKLTEFEAEVDMLSSIRHVNVVKLYCSITSEDSSLLVYEYMPRGSLWDQIHNGAKCELDWVTRHDIALGSAKGLEYLHHGLERPVIHRDVKSSNILLDEFLKPRIADFGLAKMVRVGDLYGSDSTHVIPGTLGYIAPEYGYTYKVNEKSDVYSFGVVLMELVTGKRPMEPEFGENKDIVHWVCSNVNTRDSVLSIVDSRIPDGMKEDAIKVLKIAILCTSRLPTLRPTMRSVVQMLEEAEPCKLVNVVVSKNGVENIDEESNVDGFRFLDREGVK